MTILKKRKRILVIIIDEKLSFVSYFSSRFEMDDCCLGKLCSRSTQFEHFLITIFLLFVVIFVFLILFYYKTVMDEITYEDYATKIVTEFNERS